MKKKINMRLISKENNESAGRGSMAVKFFDCYIRVVLGVFQCFKCTYIAPVKVALWFYFALDDEFLPYIAIYFMFEVT